jgi:predicted dehydrogenase
MTTDTVGWGVLAPGRIARQFAADLQLVPQARLAAVGSRSLESARTFADSFGGTPYGSYAELLADDAVDVVYVASPHALHDEQVRACLAAGKHVLCEKPLTLDARTSEALLAEARDRGLFLMEAMWMACHPLVRALVAAVRDGEHGEVRQVVADLGFVVDTVSSDRLLDPAMGAGALLDMGIYPLTLAQLLLGDPVEQTAVAHLSATGIDLDIAIAARYPSGALAALTSTMTARSPRTATVATDRGRFDLAADFHHPTAITWTPYDGKRVGTPEDLVGEEEVVGAGYGNEILEVHRCLAAGLLESPLVPHAQTVALMRQMDALRAQVGVVYPGDVAQ